MDILKAIIEEIEKYPRIIIHRHLRPDPDAIGSQVGLAEIIRESFPNKQVYQVGEEVDDLKFLASMEKIEDTIYENALVIVTDTANTARISDKRFLNGKRMIKIDHHPNDDPYGDIVWVNTKASSCCEMITDLFLRHQDKLKINNQAARLLYAGVVGDTGRFLYPATTSHTLEVAAMLMTYNFNASDLNRQLNQMSLQIAKLAGYVYQNIQIDQSGAGKVILSKELLKQYGLVDSNTAAIVPLPGTIEEIMAWSIFVEQPGGNYRVRLRSKGPVINELAKNHRGGGHPLASGANAKDENEINEIYEELQKLCKNFSPS